MATQEGKLAAAEKALADLGTSDSAEAERFVALFWSQVPLLRRRTKTARRAWAAGAACAEGR